MDVRRNATNPERTLRLYGTDSLQWIVTLVGLSLTWAQDTAAAAYHSLVLVHLSYFYRRLHDAECMSPIVYTSTSPNPINRFIDDALRN